MKNRLGPLWRWGLLCWLVVVTGVGTCCGEDVVVGTLSAPGLNHAAEADKYSSADDRFGTYWIDWHLTQVAVCPHAGGMWVAYMPTSDALAVADLTVKDGKLAVVGKPRPVGGRLCDPSSPEFMGVPACLTLRRTSGGGYAIWYCVLPWGDPEGVKPCVLMRWLSEDGKEEPVRTEFPLSGEALIRQVCLDAAGTHVFLCNFANTDGMRHGLYILDLATRKWEFRPVSVPKGRYLPDLRVLPSGDNASCRLFGVTCSGEGTEKRVVELKRGETVPASPAKGVEPLLTTQEPWTVAGDEDGRVHILYPARSSDVDVNLELMDSYETDGSWRTTTLSNIGSLPHSFAEIPSTHVCFPDAILASDGHLHVVYYSEGSSTVRQGVWIGGHWHVQDAFLVSRLTALTATEVGGKLAIVWAEDKTQHVHARLVELSTAR